MFTYPILAIGSAICAIGTMTVSIRQHFGLSLLHNLFCVVQVPDDFCWDPNTKSFGDPVNRPEIKHPTVEFIAPNEYMVRAVSTI